MADPTLSHPVHLALYVGGPGDMQTAERLRKLETLAGRLFSRTGVRLFSCADKALDAALPRGGNSLLDAWARGWPSPGGARLVLACPPAAPFNFPGASARPGDTLGPGEKALLLWLGYSGKGDILAAADRMAAREPLQAPSDARFKEGLATSGLPDPDLYIIAGGKPFLPDFFLYQISYSEIFFFERSWSQFTLGDLESALASYGKRERRYGRTEPVRAR